MRVKEEGKDRQSDETKYWLGLEMDQGMLKDPQGNPFESAKNGKALLPTLAGLVLS